MAQNFLYMFEFVVDDLLITRPNYCAPEEYPTCCEISFRSSVFVSICDREFGQCVDTCAPKCGKCCLFSLESPVTAKDRLLIHIYKKKTEKCKFLIGATDLPIKPLFDKVTESFNIENPNWMEQIAKHSATVPDPKSPSKTTVVDNDCDDEASGRREQMCPTSELTKRLLPLFNMKGMQTGNLVLIMRLVCNGPAIVSSFPFSKICATSCGPTGGRQSRARDSICSNMGSSPQQRRSSANNGNSGAQAGAMIGTGPCKMENPCVDREIKKPVCQRYFACNADKGCACDVCEDYNDRGQAECPDPCNRKPAGNSRKKCPCSPPRVPGGSCSCPDPCAAKKQQKTDICQKYFSNNNSGNQSCNCEDYGDECEAEDSIEDEESEPCPCMHPCFIEPTKPDPGPEAYEEFAACLNGSGLTIRVLKDTHQVESINDGLGGDGFDDSGSECDKCPQDRDQNNNCNDMSEFLQRSPFARNHIKRRTKGHIINHPGLPKIRANIKYSGNESCCPESYHVPFSKIKNYCESQENRIDAYRKHNRPEDCGPVVPPQHIQDMRNCCLQVDPQDLKNTLKGINVDTRKKGIEVCYKTCDDTESDVFLVKLGSKQPCQKKKNAIEIELKTPKQPIILPQQTVTIETQIDEAELDAALAGTCKKGKGKKGKGKKKKK